MQNLKKFDIIYKAFMGIIKKQSCAVKQGHTSRGFSGALYLKSATAGVDPALEGGSFTNESYSLC